MAEKDFGLDEMKEIVNDFLVEANELIESLDNNLVTLEGATDDLDLLNEIFRAAHTIKGTSGFLGFEQVTVLTHKMEDILNRLRKSEMVVTPEIMDILLESLDYLRLLLDNIRRGKTEKLDLDEILNRLTAAYDDPQTAEFEDPAPFETFSPTFPQNTATQKQPVKTNEKKAVEQTIRVDVDRLDNIINLMGELVLGRNILVQTLSRLSKDLADNSEIEQINEAAASVNYITTELQLAVMKMRMQPIGRVFKKFPRMVRDLAREAGKQIELKMSGEETELDKSVIDEIGDPLIHILRNSCDHGIEAPEERKALGKPEKGTVFLSACQEGSHIIVKIEDDGKGLDIDLIRAGAVERGLVGKNEVDRLPDREVFRYIFEAGFSTAHNITEISGRGVGMDVVRTNIEKLNGLIELDSKKGAGTAIVIKLPLTLAIIQGLLVESDGEVFILPLSSVHETIKSDQAEIHFVNQKPVFKLRDEVIPLINMDIIHSKTSGFTLNEKPYIIVVGLADRKLGINVDRFLGQEEVVIKSLGQYLGNTEGVAGAAILGDGRIRLIVDLVGLFKIAKKIS